ncbi:MAG: EbhA [Fusicatenibacter saccharivorans]|nr:EbhA [Fusicatenibacter saccharivorans]
MKKKIILFLVSTVIAVSLTGCKSGDYNEAVKLQEAGDYQAALELYESIEDYENYKDTAERVDECKAMIEAINAFDSARSSAEQKNSDLDAAISEAEALIAKGKPALDETLIPTLETAISEAKSAKQAIMEMPATEDEIVAVSQQLDSIDYGSVLLNLAEKKSALEKSIKQYALVDAPTEAYVIECLKKVENIVDISAVTEDNDPNGNLNKAGGYTAQIYFSSDLVNQSEVYGTSLIEKGTDAGGSIEVYANVEDATTRNEYLASFDGGIFASGSHTVVGTVLVRTSDELTASQQQTLEANIIAALTEIVE